MTTHCPTCNVPWADHAGIAVTCAEVQRLRDELEHTRYWYGCRLERLNQIAREEFTEEMRHRYFSIVANGTAESHEPPTYAQQYNTMKHRAEIAEEKLRSRLAAIREKLQGIVIVEGVDSGVVLLSSEGTTHAEIINGKPCQVYNHEHCSALGDALVELWEIVK